MLAEFLLQKGGKLFEQHDQLLNLWQEIAENFYPERADFTVKRSLGSEFGEGLTSSYPVLMRRELANGISGLLRPTSKVWAHVRVEKWDEVGSEARAWLEQAEARQRQAMYHADTQFSRAMKEADNDLVAFGQCVIQVSRNANANGLLYRCWHLRDVCWSENAEGKIDTVYRKWKPHVVDVLNLFPRSAHPMMHERARSNPYERVEVWHCIIPSFIYELYEKPQRQGRFPYRSIYIDVSNKHILEDVPLPDNEYVIGRWQTVSGSQYAYSPASITGLPDSRTLQEMTLTLLEAGEKSVSPPLLGVQEALRSDINVMAGGVTWVDREYDERLGEVLRPLTIDRHGLPLGMEMANNVQAQLRETFYLNLLQLPPQTTAMTAYEVSQRVQEYIRQALPLFEPLEAECNAPLCTKTFDILLKAGVFGTPYDIPRELRGKDIEFQFESPLHDAVERDKAQKYLEATSLLANAMSLDPTVIHLFDVSKASRDALLSSGVPAAWLRSEGDVEELIEEDQMNQQAAIALQQMQAGAEVAKTIGTTPTPSGTGQTGAPLAVGP